jgi:hypothetical protein
MGIEYFLILNFGDSIGYSFEKSFDKTGKVVYIKENGIEIKRV